MIRFAAEQWLMLLWAVPLAALIAAYAIAQRRSAAHRFVAAGMLPRVSQGRSLARLVIKSLLVILAIAAVAVALARPQWGTKPESSIAKGRDVCFIIDVSKSMLAEDLAPTRLDRAKLWVRDALRVIKGDRIALVAFAGESVVKCPLTIDYGFFRTSLTDLSTTSVVRGGTNIGDAIRVACKEVFEETDASFKDIILITDGEDHESFPIQAAEAAAEQGVRIIALGIGDEGVGRPIPITDSRGRRTNLTYNGEVVLSKLDADTLEKVARASLNGKYFNVSTGNIELDSVYAKLIQEAEQRETRAAEAVRYEDRFQIFLAIALALLTMEALVRERGKSA